MSINYNAIVGFGSGKTTLPSVESWGQNMNILRDPSRSIVTRKIDKVGQDSSITQMIDDSGNRNCEAISLYAKGVNPSVSVSYSNYGNNGGQGLNLSGGGQKNAKLPYPAIKDGAFRPPIMTQYQLLPLSRMPRIWTECATQPGYADFSKKMREGGTASNTKEVKTTTLQACVRPTAVYTMETPLSEPFEVKYMIQPTIKTSGDSGIRTLDRTMQNVQEPTKEVNRDMMYAFAQSNLQDVKHVDNNNFDTDPYIQDANVHSVMSNPGNEHVQLMSLDEILDLSDIKIKDLRNIEYQTPIRGNDKTDYIHTDINLDRRMPEHNATTNIGNTKVYKSVGHENTLELSRNTPLTHIPINPGNSSVYGTNNNDSSREYYLAPKVQAGGYSAPSSVPMTGRMQNVKESYNSEKSRMQKSIMEQHHGRYTH